MRFFYPGTVQKCVNVVLSRKLLQNEYLFRLLTKIGFEKAENEPSKVVLLCLPAQLRTRRTPNQCRARPPPWSARPPALKTDRNSSAELQYLFQLVKFGRIPLIFAILPCPRGCSGQGATALETPVKGSASFHHCCRVTWSMHSFPGLQKGFSESINTQSQNFSWH